VGRSPRFRPVAGGAFELGDNGNQAFARALACPAAALALLVVPAYQLVEILGGHVPTDLLWMHAGWRSPVVLIALVSLSFCLSSHKPLAAERMVRVLAAGVMVMIFGMFATDTLHASGDPETMVRGIIMATFAVSLLSLRGGRELLILFLAPFALCMAALAVGGVDLPATVVSLVDPLMMLVFAMIVSEVFYRIRCQQFDLQLRLARLARIDALTGLHNRRDLDERMEAEMSRSRRHRDPFSVVIGDLDRFKRVNDEFGHDIGDEVLREVGRRLSTNLREEDLAVRWGGEEFLLLLPGTDAEAARRVADKIRQRIADEPFSCTGQDIRVTISFGVAQFRDEPLARELIKRADAAMYRAKQSGRNRVCVA